MKKTSEEKNERQLIDETHPKQVMTNTKTKTRTTTKSDQRK
jgi:hypothetical protein